MRRILFLAAAGVLLIGIVAAGAASAAQLTLAPPYEKTVSGAAACTTSTLTVAASAISGSGTAQAVSVSNIPASCAGLNTALTVYSSAGSALSSTTTATLGTGTSSVITLGSTYTASAVTGVALTISSRSVKATWQSSAPVPTAPATAGNANTVISTQTWNSYGATNFCAVLTVTTDSTTPVAWVVNLNLALRPFNGGQSNTNAYSFSNSVPVTPGVIANQIMPVEGDASYDNTVVQGTSHSFQVCDNNAPPPANDPTRYTVNAPTTTGNAFYACVTITVTGTATDQYYSGWSTTLNMAPAFAIITGGGRTPGPVTWNPSNGVSIGTPTGTVYPVTGTGYMVGIQGGQTLTFQGCATGN